MSGTAIFLGGVLVTVLLLIFAITALTDGLVSALLTVGMLILVWSALFGVIAFWGWLAGTYGTT